ncbi:MAG: hypothetical protein DMF89_22080 [Acidobacteria bacterium]|nr:MAG: hypothetical protein DMF89_22080 [Acidobacteriota bacterium]
MALFVSRFINHFGSLDLWFFEIDLMMRRPVFSLQWPLLPGSEPLRSTSESTSSPGLSPK